ncbi:MAG: DNA-binding response regulator [Alteromonadaceae bacterium]|jgi:DNA-binding NarL/FixJ family response regulator|uniref:Glycerol metabolism activator n=2 Tax=Paraglaciecola mesophila TaxID=197222 RepID=K6YHT5_9ALTE|nr:MULTISPECIES: response regulator transcription factor [Paraglaciecola]ABG42527.1 two component transcriptional regulator, LuxR family [Paraglaciecola sp. T6c]MAD16052.1 DNA-binding response regulator [Alteromonadaceae bacterium]GAC23546.1 glycerol metabolism activator [Paraglaciecola mesophila KMM 241]|tara:strand:- start:8785 stop:9423 length:639 start_codon:yes stop_codon:yes gene_type:complete
MAKFLIADDHPLFREALVGALSPLFEDIEILQSDSLDSTLMTLHENPDIDLILLDLHMPGCENFYGLIRVTQDYPEIPVAVVSASDSIEVVSYVMSFGAKGFVPKSSPTLMIADALKTIMSGEIWLTEELKAQIAQIDGEELNLAQRIAELTPKQFQVLKLIHDGLLNKQIAHELNVTEATVKAHISAVFRKLEVNTRTQAVLLLKKLNLED